MAPPTPPSNIELARLAVAKAKEHLASAERLRSGGDLQLAYGHLVYALEESGKGAVRLLVELGVLRWGAKFGGVQLDEKKLTDVGSHKFKAYVGGAFALAGVVRECLGLEENELRDELRKRGVKNMKEAAAVAAEKLLPRLPTLLTSDYQAMLGSAQAKREAAFYSGPKRTGDPLPEAPTVSDYDELILAVRGSVEGLAFLDRPRDPNVVEFVKEFVDKFLGGKEH